MKNLFLITCLLIVKNIAAQNVGIGTTDPRARLHVADSNVLFSSALNLPANAGITPASGSGTRMMWYADKAALRAGGIEGAGWDKIFTGNYSVALGYNTIASGMYSLALNSNTVATANYSTALGYATSANGNGSIAMGGLTTASGEHSFSSGYFSEAIGKFSFAAGFYSQAKASGSFTLGSFNDISDNPDPIVPAGSDRIFQVGNGSSNARSNALTILHNGNVGIGTVQPVSALHVANKSVVFTNATLPVTPQDPPLSGAGVRMMWYADKAAFRVGQAQNNDWDKDKIGIQSFASGFSPQASGQSSVAMGFGSTASGLAASAFGNSRASGDISASFGQSNASGVNSFAGGEGTYANTRASASFGYYTKAKSIYSFVAGMFNDTTATNRIFEIGNGSADNNRRNAVTVLSNGNTGIGTSTPVNRLDVAGLNNWDLSNTEGDFRIGNDQYRIKMGVALGGGGAGAAIIRAMGGINLLALGAGNQNMVTLNGANGFVGIGLDNPSQKLHVAGNILATGTITPSDIRYKKDIHPITNPLQKVEQLHGVTYQYRADEFPGTGFDTTTQVGLIAQDVEKVFPQLVFTDDKGYKAVDYTKLIPLLIEGMKAQQQQIEILKEEISRLKKEK